jgi:hypothetical protein
MSETPETEPVTNTAHSDPRVAMMYWHERAMAAESYFERLTFERDDLRTMWERDSTALGVAIGQRDTARAIAEDNRARYVTAERERDELRAVLMSVRARAECTNNGMGADILAILAAGRVT